MFHSFFLKTLLFSVFAFKAVAETTVWFWGGVSESKLYYAKLSIGKL